MMLALLKYLLLFFMILNGQTIYLNQNGKYSVVIEKNSVQTSSLGGRLATHDILIVLH